MCYLLIEAYNIYFVLVIMIIHILKKQTTGCTHFSSSVIISIQYQISIEGVHCNISAILLMPSYWYFYYLIDSPSGCKFNNDAISNAISPFGKVNRKINQNIFQVINLASKGFSANNIFHQLFSHNKMIYGMIHICLSCKIFTKDNLYAHHIPTPIDEGYST